MPQRQDSGYTTNDMGEVTLVVRKDSAASISNADGDYTPMQADASGSLRVVDAAAATAITAAGVAATTPLNTEATVFASAARIITTNSADQTNLHARGVKLFLNVSAVSGTSPTLDVKLQAKDGISGVYYDIAGAEMTQKIAVTKDDLVIYPGATATANRSVSSILPKTWRVVATIGGTDTPTFTFSLGASYVL